MNTIDLLNPATEQLVVRQPLASVEEVDAAVAAASAASPQWRAVAPSDRALLLRRYADAIAAHAEELAQLDWRERDYERTDVSDQIRSELGAGTRIVTYVPRPSAVERYETARDGGRAAIRRPYWDLVADAFRQLGTEHHELYSTTPAPDVPVVDMSLSMLG